MFALNEACFLVVQSSNLLVWTAAKCGPTFSVLLSPCPSQLEASCCWLEALGSLSEAADSLLSRHQLQAPVNVMHAIILITIHTCSTEINGSAKKAIYVLSQKFHYGKLTVIC